MTTRGAITRKQQEAIAALLTTSTIEAAADKLGIASKTMHRWLQREDFARAYKDARSAAFDRAVARLHLLADKAFKTLERNLESGVPASEIAAVRVWWEQQRRSADIAELEARLEVLERNAAECDEDDAGAGR